MATIVIPDSVRPYFPRSIDPAMLWVHYNPSADSLVVYFTGKPIPTVWSDVDEYAYVGFDMNNSTSVTGMMIEHFSKWLLLNPVANQQLEPA